MNTEIQNMKVSGKTEHRFSLRLINKLRLEAITEYLEIDVHILNDSSIKTVVCRD